VWDWYIILCIYNYTFISIYNTYYVDYNYSYMSYSFDGCTNIVMPMYYFNNNDCELKYKSVIE